MTQEVNVFVAQRSHEIHPVPLEEVLFVEIIFGAARFVLWMGVKHFGEPHNVFSGEDFSGEDITVSCLLPEVF